ncbi:MAG: U32 family peptidase, partial [Schwartzia sp.]|nr:U32 family peptidase [Schwartzia sp. (in: firmicutes)]
MILSRSSVELLAPAGNWEALEAAVKAGADAVYLGGKHFNMRLHRQDMNFDDEALARAVSFAHTHGVKLYVTINNLIYENELGDLEKFLRYLGTIGPDAILVQDLAVIRLVRDLDLKIPLHASVMMNIHNEPAMNLLKEYGITRVVASRELSLDELSLLRERTGLEIEYFMHGDMCFAESGQCIHSGVLFGKSSNRGLCLKPCRWPYRLIDEETGEILDENGRGAYKLAIKDMCMYRHIPELIQAGVFSFKIEGRMRPADFVFRIGSLYRKAIDTYLADPTGYRIDEDDWRTLYDGR